jgi:CSLREA domain-containing protein
MRTPRDTPHRWTSGRALSLSKGAKVAATALLSGLALALVVWLAVIPATRVQAATYTVNATGDDGDDNVGDGVCHTAGGQCTLRAAIEEANASVDDDVIAIGTAGPIVLLGGLPTITDDDLIITGSDQQVSLTAPGIAFDINADRVHISDLVIDGEGVGTLGIQISTTSDDLVLDGLTVRSFTDDGFDNSGGGGGKRNTIQNSTFTGNAGVGIDFNGGEDNVVRDNVITNNGDNIVDDGLEVSNEDNFLIQGNTFSGNFNAQIDIAGMLAGQNLSIIQNTITSGSDGIVIGAAVNATAAIDIGLSVPNRNVFRGTIAAPAEQHLRNLSPANINAIYNDWDAYSPAAIEGVICHNVDPGCGPGIVDFDPFIDTPSPLPTATGTPTVTETPGAETATPTVTVTVTPGGVETVALVAGCNPVAWTGTNATPISNIASAVSPADILVALWQFEGGVWLGYSPQFPDVSDLTEMDRLDVVFVCVSAAGTFSRPII